MPLSIDSEPVDLKVLVGTDLDMKYVEAGSLNKADVRSAQAIGSSPRRPLVGCIQENSSTWGLPDTDENPSLVVAFFLRPKGPPSPHEDRRASTARTLVENDATLLSFAAGYLLAPRKIAGPDVKYTPAALSRGVQGQMRIKCVLEVSGAFRDCRILQTLDFMNEGALKACEKARYEPARWNDEPLEVSYRFKLNLVIP